MLILNKTFFLICRRGLLDITLPSVNKYRHFLLYYYIYSFYSLIHIYTVVVYNVVIIFEIKKKICRNEVICHDQWALNGFLGRGAVKPNLKENCHYLTKVIAMYTFVIY